MLLQKNFVVEKSVNMLFEKFSNPEQMSTNETEIGDSILKNDSNSQHEKDNENLKKKTLTEKCFDDKIDLSSSTSKSKSSLRRKLSEIFPHRKQIGDIPVAQQIRLVKKTNLPMKKQLEYLVNDLQKLNNELEKNCGIHNGFAHFLDLQKDFTIEILDAYITSVNLTKNDFNQYFGQKNIEQKRAYHDLGKSINMPKNLTKNEIENKNKILDDYDDEIELRVTQLEWQISPENVPLPIDIEEEHLHQNLGESGTNQVLLETVADIHATMVGDQKITIEPENISLASSGCKDAGEYKVQRPVPDPQPLEKSFDSIEEVEQKNKGTIKSKFRSFFAKTQNRNRVTINDNY